MTLKIVAFSLVLTAGTYGLLRAYWPEASPPLANLSPLTFDDPLPTLGHRPHDLLRTEPLAVAPIQPLPLTRPPAARVLDIFRQGLGGDPPDELMRRAEAGEAAAQLALAQVYERGAGGVRRNAPEARRWTRRAAGGGDSAAMHNLGLYLLEGEGGPRDVAEAAAWFRRAAERGVVDAQFNLAVLLAMGEGVTADAAEAYRWLAVAAAAGDRGARQRMAELEGRLSVGQRNGMIEAAARFRAMGPTSSGHEALIISPASTVIETQQLLARKGYYVGPVDGAESLAFLKAASAYLKDHPAAAQAIDLP